MSIYIESSRIFSFYSSGRLQIYNDDNFPLYLSTNRTLDLDLATVNLGLPSPSTFVQQSRDLAFPQIIAFATALTGIFLVFYILRSLKP